MTRSIFANWRQMLPYCGWAAVAFVAGTLLQILFLRWLPVPITPLMVLRLIEGRVSPGKEPSPAFQKEWRPLSQISPQLALAVVCAEDQNFPRHHGFDFEAISRAIKNNAAIEAGQARGLRQGASTISQQTFKNIYLWPQRSWIRKGLEVWYTALSEFAYPKERIMELYLNVAEFGPGIYGAEAASRRFFRKSARELYPAEAALLAATLPNPRLLRPDAPVPWLYARQQGILEQMRLWGGVLDYKVRYEK